MFRQCSPRHEQKLYDLGFRSLRPREFVSLSLVGEWKNAEPGERVITEGEPVSSLSIPITGIADVRRRGERIARADTGHIIGTGAQPSPANHRRWK